MIDTSRYMGRTYHGHDYNCAHLACDVWQDITGKDIRPALTGLLTGRNEREIIPSALRIFLKLAKPVTPCLVLFQGRRRQPHAGIWLRGRVLHICERGVEWLPIEMVGIGYSRWGFWTC